MKEEPKLIFPRTQIFDCFTFICPAIMKMIASEKSVQFQL